ncbi:MAG TPA: response regulator [Acetobacteraceae bacterium]|jgi:CheY-like chemotaxis protein|nr:response regulator [Acetobacteraceae bacterium]
MAHRVRKQGQGRWPIDPNHCQDEYQSVTDSQSIWIDGRLSFFTAIYPEFCRHELSADELSLAHEGAHMSKKLLLINDRRGLARTIGSVAPDLGFEIITLDHVSQAATRIAEVAPDVVILDLAVPADEMIELLRSIVQTGTDAKILIAARADDPATRVAEGMARFHVGERLAFLRRPFNRRKIIEALRIIFDSTVSFALSAA